MRNGFGIPMSLQRPGPEEGQSFALYLSGLIEESFEQAGSNVAVVKLDKGQKIEQAVTQVAELGKTSLIMLILRSRYDAMFTSDYRYDFTVLVTDPGGQIMIEKSFSDWEKDIPASNKYNVFDMHTEIYKNILDKIINDPEIQQALSGR